MKKYSLTSSWLKILVAFFIVLSLQSISVFGQWMQQPFPYSWFPQDSSGGEGTAFTVLNADTVLYSRSTYNPYKGMLRKTTDGGVNWQTVDTLSFYWGKIGKFILYKYKIECKKYNKKIKNFTDLQQIHCKIL